jgi:hypothetical protein
MTQVKLALPTATIELSPSELVILVNALNEVCNGLDIAEFATRIGSDRKTAEQLLAEMRSVADSVLTQ